MDGFYHEGTRALADRNAQIRLHDRFTEDDAACIGRRIFFVLGRPMPRGADCSYWGGEPGFVRVVAPDLLVFPDYDGNGMFKSPGNVRVPSASGCSPSQWARRSSDGSASASTAWPNSRPTTPCSRSSRRPTAGPSPAHPDIPELPALNPENAHREGSPYNPRVDYDPPMPEWKTRDDLRDMPPPRRT